uniref:Uncharacterized protein n=1 Tax=Meloidogyne javanica TaxID=6303 RepID=A0A915LT91_MELJA
MNYFTGNENENIGVVNCKHFCSISNPNSLSCWNETLQFYESMLINILRQTVIVEINRVLWIHSNQNNLIKNSEFFGTTVEKLANDSLSRFMKLPNKFSVKDGNNWKNSKNVFARISPAIAKNVFHHVKHIRLYNYGLELPLLDFNCPQGCENKEILLHGSQKLLDQLDARSQQIIDGILYNGKKFIHDVYNYRDMIYVSMITLGR